MCASLKNNVMKLSIKTILRDAHQLLQVFDHPEFRVTKIFQTFRLLGCQISMFPIHYIGLPLSTQELYQKHFCRLQWTPLQVRCQHVLQTLDSQKAADWSRGRGCWNIKWIGRGLKFKSYCQAQLNKIFFAYSYSMSKAWEPLWGRGCWNIKWIGHFAH